MQLSNILEYQESKYKDTIVDKCETFIQTVIDGEDKPSDFYLGDIKELAIPSKIFLEVLTLMPENKNFEPIPYGKLENELLTNAFFKASEIYLNIGEDESVQFDALINYDPYGETHVIFFNPETMGIEDDDD